MDCEVFKDSQTRVGNLDFTSKIFPNCLFALKTIHANKENKWRV